MIEIPIRLSSPDNGLQQEDSIKIVSDLIDSEVAAGIPADRIVVGGFSQGAALAFATVLKYPTKLAGSVLFSGWELKKQNLKEAAAVSANKEIPFFIAHGTMDGTVLPENSKDVTEWLSKSNPKVTLKLYDGMAHSSCPQGTSPTDFNSRCLMFRNRNG